MTFYYQNVFSFCNRLSLVGCPLPPRYASGYMCELISKNSSGYTGSRHYRSYLNWNVIFMSTFFDLAWNLGRITTSIPYAKNQLFLILRFKENVWKTYYYNINRYNTWPICRIFSANFFWASNVTNLIRFWKTFKKSRITQ